MKIKKEFIMREIAGECILVPTGKTAQEFNGFLNISSTGQFIWENLEKVESLDELVAKILDEFEVDEATARQDTIEFIGKLLGADFVEMTDPAKNW